MPGRWFALGTNRPMHATSTGACSAHATACREGPALELATVDARISLASLFKGMDSG